jgi:ABC-type branched-subunit amino acid transport system ATPase component/ABC-type branched-subunit amino acid transport system permease subunit
VSVVAFDRLLEAPVVRRARDALGGRRADLLLIALALVLLPILTHRAMPRLLKSSDALVLSEGAALAAAALSLNLLLGYAGQISLGHAGLLGVGAFASGLLCGRHGLPMWVGVPVAGLAGGVVAFVVGVPSLRLRGLYLAMATLAFGYAMEQSVFRLNALTGGSAGVALPRRIEGDRLLLNNADFLAVVLLVLFGLWLLDVNVRRTKLGRAFHAIRQDEAVAQAFGVDVTRYKLAAFTLSGAFAGIAGALYGHGVGFVNSETFDFQLSLLLVIIVVVGGLGHRGAVITAAMFFAVFPRFIKSLHGYDLILGAALLMFTVARHPGGLASMARERGERRAEHEARRRAAAEGEEIEEEGKLPSFPELPRPPAVPARVIPDDGVLLEAVDLSVRFGGLQALREASITVPAGKVVGLIGPNGAGKTTLFNAVSGHVRTESGRVRFGGEDVSALAAHERAALGIARSFQLIGLAKELSVRENFLLAQHQLAAYGMGAALGFTRSVSRVEAGLEERAREAITALGFERFTETPVRQLSHGQQRIVEIGCLLATSPELLMLDEPSAGMSPAAAENLAERLADLPDRLGQTVLIIEHNLPLVMDVCDHLYVLHLGQVLAEGTPDEVTSRDDVVQAYLGTAVA